MTGGNRKTETRKWACFLFSLFYFLVFAQTALAQGSRKDDIVLNTRGHPVAGAMIRVCTAAATGAPCSPLATIYSNLALTQTKSNPFTADGGGNYNFYAAPGRYVIQISGSGISTLTIPDVILPADPSGGGTEILDTLTVGKLNNIRIVEGSKFAKTATGVNAALNDIGSGNPGIVFVPPGNVDLSDAVITLGKKHRLVFGEGEYTVAGINVPDSTTDTSGVSGIEGAGSHLTTLKLKNAANRDVITNTNFATLTGTDSDFGTFRLHLKGLKIDGNKANQTGTSYGIRVYGRAHNWLDLIVTNAKNDGIWTEWGLDLPGFANEADDLDSYFTDIKTIGNDGDGWEYRGPHDGYISNLSSFGNGGWGFQNENSATNNASVRMKNVNAYTNTLGGIRAGDGIIGMNIAGTTASGTGFLIDTGTGQTVITSGTFAGPKGLVIKSANHIISGAVVNCSTYGVEIDGGQTLTLDINVFNNNSPQVRFTSGGGQSMITVTGDATGGAASLFSGTVPSNATVFGNVAGQAAYMQLGSQTLRAGGWAPVLPNSNATFVVPDLAQTFSAAQTFTGNATFGSGGTAITKHLSATASLNFTALAANSCEVLTMTVTGAADGDTVVLGIPNALADVDGATERTVFFAWVSAADTVSVRRCNVTGAATVDPAAATVRADVWRH